MKNKFTRTEEWKKYRLPNEEAIFFDTSPFCAISSPRGNFTFALQVSGGRSTLYAIRTDSNDTVRFNTDEYVFEADSSVEKNRIIGPLKTEYHHTDHIPTPLKPFVPEYIKSRIEDIKNG